MEIAATVVTDDEYTSWIAGRAVDKRELIPFNYDSDMDYPVVDIINRINQTGIWIGLLFLWTKIFYHYKKMIFFPLFLYVLFFS